MEGKTIVSSAILAIGIAAGCWLLGSAVDHGVQSIINRDRVVTVKGLAEQQVLADHVIWPISYRELGNDLQQVYAQVERRAQQVVQFLQAAGIDASEITIATPNVNDAQADSYGGQKRIYRYSLTQTVTVSTDKVDVVNALKSRQRELIRQGITLTTDYDYRTMYQFTGLNAIKPQMIETATRNAREAAQKFAADSGSALGKIRRANQGQFSIYDRDSNTPYIKNVRVVTTVEYFLND